MRRLVSSACAATVAVFARRAVVGVLVVLTALCVTARAQAETPLRRPLSFLPAASVLVVTPGAGNVVERVMQVSPYLRRRPTRSPPIRHAPSAVWPRGSPISRCCSADTLARLFLVTGEAHIAAALDRERLRRDSLLSAHPTDRAAAQALLNTLGWVAASEGTDLYVNLPVDCMINVATPALRCTVDQICEMGRVKYRLSGFPAQGSALRLHLRLPAGVAPDQVFLNGRRLLAPQIERGYLVVDRAWRNNEELYYDLPERKQLFGE